MPSHILNFQLQLVLCALPGSLEGKMLQEVRNTIRPICLRPAPGIYPHTACRCLRIWGVFCRNLRIAGHQLAIPDIPGTQFHQAGITPAMASR